MINLYAPTNKQENLYLLNYQEKIKIFLAGGIDKAPDWQSKAIEYFKTNYSYIKNEHNIALFNPRRSVPFSKDCDNHNYQVSWEFTHLRLAKYILFWFPENAPCTTSLFELGFWINSGKVFLGINPGHYKEKSIKTQLNLLRDNTLPWVKDVRRVYSSLEETIDAVMNYSLGSNYYF